MIDKAALDRTYKELLEEKIIGELAKEKKITIREAMDKYYRSRLSAQINNNSFGIENMDYRYLVRDLIENESDIINT